MRNEDKDKDVRETEKKATNKIRKIVCQIVCQTAHALEKLGQASEALFHNNNPLPA